MKAVILLLFVCSLFANAQSDETKLLADLLGGSDGDHTAPDSISGLIEAYHRYDAFFLLHRSDMQGLSHLKKSALPLHLSDFDQDAYYVVLNDAARASWGRTIISAKYRRNGNAIQTRDTKAALVVTPHAEYNELVAQTKAQTKSLLVRALLLDYVSTQAKEFPIIRVISVDCGDFSLFSSPHPRIGFRVEIWMEREPKSEHADQLVGKVLGVATYAATANNRNGPSDLEPLEPGDEPLSTPQDKNADSKMWVRYREIDVDTHYHKKLEETLGYGGSQ